MIAGIGVVLLQGSGYISAVIVRFCFVTFCVLIHDFLEITFVSLLHGFSTYRTAVYVSGGSCFVFLHVFISANT
jgi:hypothetical protein